MDHPIQSVAAKFGFLNDLLTSLAFPPSYTEIKLEELEPLANHYIGINPDKSIPIEPDSDTKPDIRDIAKGLYNYLDVDKEVEEHLKLQENTNPEDSEYESMAYKAREAAIIRPGSVMKSLLYEFVSILMFNTPIKTLYVDAMMGDEESLFKLLQIDKTALTTRWGNLWIREKQYDGDWDWFQKVGEAIAKLPMTNEPYLFQAVIVTAYLWDDYFSNMPWPEIVKSLKKEKILPRSMPPENFRKIVNRVGLQKPRYNEKN